MRLEKNSRRKKERKREREGRKRKLIFFVICELNTEKVKTRVYTHKYYTVNKESQNMQIWGKSCCSLRKNISE